MILAANAYEVSHPSLTKFLNDGDFKTKAQMLENIGAMIDENKPNEMLRHGLILLVDPDFAIYNSNSRHVFYKALGGFRKFMRENDIENVYIVKC